MLRLRTFILLVAVCFMPRAAMAQNQGTLRGNVTIEQTGTAVAGATVLVAGLSAVTDASGAFEVRGLPAGEHEVAVTHASVTPTVRTVRIEAGAATVLQVSVGLRALHEEVTVQAFDVRNLLPGGIDNTPGAASSLSAPELRQYRPTTLHEALALVPGVRTIDDDAMGRRSGIGVRGAPPRRSRRVLLLEDGVPINAATYLDPSTHYTPPVERLERIDVLKGAGQLVHGPLNNHGIINFRTLQPTTVPRTTVDVGLGTAGDVRRHVRHTRTIGPAGIALAYSGMNADGVFDTEDHRYDDFFGSVTWDVGPRHEVAGSMTYFRERSHYDERNLTLDEYAIDPRGKLRLGEGADLNTMSVGYLKGHLTHRFLLNERVTFTSHVFATELDRPRFESRRGGPLADSGYMAGRERRYTTAGGASRVEWATPRLNSTWEAGLRWEQQAFDNRSTVGGIGEHLGPGNRGTLAVEDDVLFLEDGRRETLAAWALSGFVQNSVTIGRAVVTPGVRIERYHQSRTVEFRPGAPLPPRETDMRTLVLPGISASYPVDSTTRLYAGAHRGYSPAIARTEDFPLVPETGVDLQVGLRSRRIPGVTVDLSAFSNRLQNTIVKKTFTDEFGANVFVNSGASHVRGVDAGVRFDSQGYTSSAPMNVFVHAVYGLADARFTGGPIRGNQVPEVARHTGQVSAGIEHDAGWSVSLSVSRFGRFFTDEANTVELSAGDPDEPLEIVGVVPGHTLLSVRATVPLPGTRTTLWVQGRNLANRLYLSDIQDGLRPGRARAVSAGLLVDF